MCRGLFRDRGVLHRDIRPDNLLWNDSSTIPAAGAAPVPTVFISHLLDPRYVIFPMWELILAESHASEPKHKSSIILIDFDNAEIYTSNERVKGGRSVSFIRFSLYDKSVMKAQGTPFFMAQAIRKGGPLSKPKTFPLSLVLRSDSAFIYQRKYPDRFKLFGNEEKRPTRLSRKETRPVFRHELRHDGESTVLIFFWWIVFAAPQGKGLVYIDQMFVLARLDAPYSLWIDYSAQRWRSGRGLCASWIPSILAIG